MEGPEALPAFSIQRRPINLIGSSCLNDGLQSVWNTTVRLEEMKLVECGTFLFWSAFGGPDGTEILDVPKRPDCEDSFKGAVEVWVGLLLGLEDEQERPLTVKRQRV